jgi:hypothetical protein
MVSDVIHGSPSEQAVTEDGLWPVRGIVIGVLLSAAIWLFAGLVTLAAMHL